MTDKLLDATADLDAFAPIVILRLRNMTAIDATGLHALERFSDRLEAIGADAGAVRRARSAGARSSSRPSSWSTWAGTNIVPHVQAALERAHEIRPKAALS